MSNRRSWPPLIDATFRKMSSFTQFPAAPLAFGSPKPKVVLDNVYLNGIHVLHQFELRKVSTYPLTVKLRWGLGSQVGVQLTNELLAGQYRQRGMAASVAARRQQAASLSLASSIESAFSAPGLPRPHPSSTATRLNRALRPPLRLVPQWSLSPGRRHRPPPTRRDRGLWSRERS
ncbi:hypothetical protein BDK51DRAFT_41337 [Blyttiomyces helicus]|uniref:Uncharacterized protein n=1 Tax=Blyttiomyces helicus TaxID=388810 RepID=A0A4P9WGP8_9FUNG|nr:hypothetical protein BDK51DRAFT_41337 [Blyttiomyces helicus]|eukprot:RKO91522.1 hypothetical protein BDK51DRAFT_41337 [Blyttiomyces helicus]